METKNQDEALFKHFKNSELTNHFTVPPVGLAGGISLSWIDDLQVEILFSSPNIIDTKIEAHGTSSFVSFIYGAPNPSDRPAFWSKLTELGAEREEAWLLTGYFNDLLDNSEKVGGPIRWEGSFLSFRSFVSQMGLWDFQHSGRCEYLRFEGSDHRPIVVHFDVSTRRKKGLFRFDRRLKDKPKVRQLVEAQWKKEQLDSVLTRIGNIRHSIIKWTREQNLNSNRAIQSAQQRLEEALSNPVPDAMLIGELTTTLESAYKEEELFWRQRSRILWLQCGDRNTAYFHAATHGRRAVNKFSVLEDVEGKARFKEQEIVQCITVYYSRIFSAQMSDSSQVVHEGITPLVTGACSRSSQPLSPITSRPLLKGERSDNVLITHEILHYLQHSEAKVRCSMAIKTDMSKAYDRIEWGFLRNVLARFGFHELWISWIMTSVTSVSYSYLVNGAAQGKVMPTRGIRQGDPLSPYLFILCTEVLSGLCRKAQQKGEVVGVKVARSSPAINHLLFADDTMFFTRTDHRSCAALIAILKKYEEASGQFINLEKSAITFSAKTPGEAKRRIRDQLQILNEGGLGKYLGLPEHFGRKKRDVFASLVNRIRQRSHSWTTRFLTGAGKLILLKSVLAAMPIYSMSCFKLALLLCKQIQSVLTRFWWDISPEVRKMCWVSWQKLTKPKSAGGLGFREIEQFNDAMLAKLSWRIMKNPTSLLAKTLTGKYCVHESFLEAQDPSSASHGWRGILVGRDLLRKGIGWAIGSAWRVSSLITPGTNEWDVEAIRETLPHYENFIRRLIPSALQAPDELVWLPNASGEYTTKSGYAVAKLCNGTQEDRTFKWKKCIWQVDTSPKIKHFMWKANNRALPVGSVLQARGLSSEVVCKRCGAVETELHVLLKCPFAAKVWDLVPCMFKPSVDNTNSISSLLQQCRRMLSLPPSGLGTTPLYPWILWILWTNRNKLMFENTVFSEQDTVLKALQDARAWKAAQSCDKMPSIPQCVVHLSQLPVANSYTWSSYSDAAWNPSTWNCGIGWLLRDADNAVAERSSSYWRYVPSALVAEALAVKAAITAAISSHVSSIRVYSDSKNLVSLLKNQGQDVVLKGVLHDINVLARSFSYISFIFVPRLKNVEADLLAKAALFPIDSDGTL
ncbi:PREDICTED: uncharacterized protein LOC106320384 [Brassica oleracea var. oleracea]|uniref:uncharacterized protein LOC106320384 n=1 Tax=Brassica oleracea var. oleracea TaxID=109376 RepID=UPI0006A71544|nr:PREDICTED: uncharacterized protein LOC106320384 [Brassica oleracea var. oleracea]